MSAMEPRIISEFSEKTRTALQRLSNYKTLSRKYCKAKPYSRCQLVECDFTEGRNRNLDTYPKNKTAAVLLLLFERDGVLRVLLTTRSKHLRSHPGQTALPGGKCEPQDSSVVDTALRESYEECGLDPKSPSLQYVATLPPFLSQWRLLVTPVVMFLHDPKVIDTLNPNADEVDCIFSHPLEAILDPSLVEDEVLSRKGTENWPYEEELYNATDSIWTQMRSTVYRMHRFRSSASPVKGLTADILILAAQIVFERDTVYERYATGQVTGQEMVLWAIEDLSQTITAPTSSANGLQPRIEESAK